MVNFFLSFSKTKRICESSRRGRGGDHVTLGVGKKAAGGECRGKAQKGKKTSCLNLPTVGDPAGIRRFWRSPCLPTGSLGQLKWAAQVRIPSALKNLSAD